MKPHFEIISACLLYGITLVHCRYDEYHYVGLTMSWKDAQQYCRNHYTDLATLKNIDDVNRIMPVSGVWIGLADDPASWKGVMTADSNSWKWSSTGTTSPGGYQNFASGEPNNYNGEEWCVFIANGEWMDGKCVNNLNFSCYDVQAGIKQYHLITTPKNWADAQTYCRQHYLDLAMIETATENQAVRDIQLDSPHAWIGLSRQPYRWSDGNNSTYQRWNPGEPNNGFGIEYCAILSNKYWNDIPCSFQMPFICLGALFKRDQIKITLKTAADMTDPAFKDNFLKALVDHLEGKGISFPLKWTVPPTKKGHL